MSNNITDEKIQYSRFRNDAYITVDVAPIQINNTIRVGYKRTERINYDGTPTLGKCESTIVKHTIDVEKLQPILQKCIAFISMYIIHSMEDDYLNGMIGENLYKSMKYENGCVANNILIQDICWKYNQVATIFIDASNGSYKYVDICDFDSNGLNIGGEYYIQTRDTWGDERVEFSLILHDMQTMITTGEIVKYIVYDNILINDMTQFKNVNYIEEKNQ